MCLQSVGRTKCSHVKISEDQIHTPTFQMWHTVEGCQSTLHMVATQHPCQLHKGFVYNANTTVCANLSNPGAMVVMTQKATVVNLRTPLPSVHYYGLLVFHY